MPTNKMPFSLPSDYIKILNPPDDVAQEDSCFVFEGSKLLVQKDTMQLPSARQLPPSELLYLGKLKERHYFASFHKLQAQNFEWQDLRGLHGLLDEDLHALAGRGLQLLSWQNSHLFCGTCGAPTAPHKEELARECTACGYIAYPRISPAIIVIIKKGKDQILLARSPHFPEGMYSAIAGFVEPGETLEQCVAREIYEEVGLTVSNIRYISSQPWPFPHSLMVGFMCDWREGSIKIDPLEIEAANWFTKETLPPLPPSVSIASQLIHKALQS